MLNINQNQNKNILDIVEDKYYVSLPNKSEDRVTGSGLICCFKDENIEIAFVLNAVNDELEHISTEVERDFTTYTKKYIQEAGRIF